jgi:glycosyltransferase involved in cell wall biosynthesis
MERKDIMNKPKILIVVPSFNSGGTVTSLINFVTLVDKSRYNLNVFAITNSGVNKKFIAEQCNIIGDSGSDIVKPTAKVIIRNKVFSIVKKLKKGLEKIGVDISPMLFSYYAGKLDKGNYDFVIAFQEGQATLFCSYFKHGFKIAWVRSEYARFIKSVGNKYSKIYEKYNRIVSVSNASMDSFLGILPQYKDVAVVQHNFLNDDRIITLSREVAVDLDDSDIFTIISVGRIDPVKRFSEIPRISRSLIDKGLKFRWIILGGTAVRKEYELIMKNIKEYKTDNIFLLGNRSNPYPYIKKSNLLVSLSISETFNNTLTEAKILGVPVVTTNYPCAYESIKQNQEGVITSFNNVEDSLFKMITNIDNSYIAIKDYLLDYHYEKDKLLENLYQRVLNN